MSDQSDNPINPGPPSSPPPFGGAPTPGPSPFAPPSQPVYANTEPSPVYADPHATQATALSEGSGPKRSRGKMVGALVGVVAILGAGTFAITKIASGDDSSGGADSPKAVGEQLFKSLDGEDLLGVMDLLLPGERETFKQPLTDLNKELKRLEVTSDEVDLNKVPGLDITIEDQKVRERPTNVDDITNIDVSGTASLKVNGKDLPIGKLLIDRVFHGDDPEVDDSENTQDFDIGLTTVKDGSKWYLSLLYTAASHAAGDADVPEEGVAPAGSDTPDGALDDLLKAAGDLDLEKIVAGLNPNEAAALQRYAPLFLDDAQNAMDGADVEISISDATYGVSGSGDRRQVSIRSINVDLSSGGQSATIELKDGCTTVTSGAQSLATCSGEGSEDQAIDDYLDQLGMSDSKEMKALIEDMRAAFSDFSMKGIVVDKVDGKWFVSPLGTGAEFVLSVLRALDRDELDTLIDDIQAAVQEFIDNISIGSDDFPDYPDDSTVDTIPYDTTFDTIPDDTVTDDTTGFTIPDDTVTDDSTFDTSTSDTVSLDETTFWSDCIFGPTTEEAKTCIAAGVADGRFDPETIPGPFLYPDCGLFDYYNGEPNGEIYTDSPEAYQDKIEPGLQCVIEAAAKDGVDLTYTTPEFVHPECYVGVNPYNYSDDNASEAISDAYDCATNS